MTATKLSWRGDEIRLQMEEATLGGIDEIMGRCVDDAKGNHPFQNRTGKAEASIQAKAAKATSYKISGRWGSSGRGVRYFFYLEVGTKKMQAFPTLRPAADRNYPELPAAIRARTRVD